METKDTLTIQMASLDAFADGIGYKRELVKSNTYLFQYGLFTGEDFVSFKTMVSLHNAYWQYDVTDQVFYPHTVQIIRNKGKYSYHDIKDEPFTKVFKLSPYEHRKAQSRKIIERVKIQCDKLGALHCQSNYVEFVCPLYEKEFLGE